MTHTDAFKQTLGALRGSFAKNAEARKLAVDASGLTIRPGAWGVFRTATPDLSVSLVAVHDSQDDAAKEANALTDATATFSAHRIA